MNKLIEQLFLIRRKKHITLKKIADFLGTTEANISHYERFRRRPSLDRLIAWAEYLGYQLEISLIPQTNE